MSYGMDGESKYWRDEHVKNLEQENAKLKKRNDEFERIIATIIETFSTDSRTIRIADRIIQEIQRCGLFTLDEELEVSDE